MVARVRRIEAVSCDSAHEAAWLERNLLTTSLPPWNKTVGGQENPVYIRLDPRSARPGLSVAHLPANRPAAFEVAGDITSELRALEWVTSPQRASSMAATDFTASGWSGGVLTSFIVRRGQVRAWAQAACPEPDAAARLAGTPPDWAGFARRNAELAAALTSRRGS
jgi:excinuclease UvrABC nuclease subunit